MMRERLWRWRWALGIAAVVAAGLVWSLWPEAVAVDEAEVTRGPMQVGITDDGVTRVQDLYTVSAPVTGYVTRIELDSGDEVVAGKTIIARMSGAPATPLDDRSRAELGDALAAARAAERGASAALELARSDLARAEALAQRGFLARAQLEGRRTEALTRAAELARARAEKRRIEASLAEPASSGLPRGGAIAVRSPASGVLLRRMSESEGLVLSGTPLVTIGDPRKIEVVIDLLSREAAQVRPGAVVEITRWGGPRPLRGRVKLVEPFGQLKISALGIEEQRVNVIVDFLDEAGLALAALGHGYQVDGTIILWRSDKVLRVPVGALFKGDDRQWQVFVDVDGKARLRSIRIGHLNDRFGEVLAGLEEGDRVVLNPGSMVDDGKRIRLRQ